MLPHDEQLSFFLSSGSRNQGLIALSSAEAETYAATSGACDALFLSRCLEYLLEVTIGNQAVDR